MTHDGSAVDVPYMMTAVVNGDHDTDRTQAQFSTEVNPIFALSQTGKEAHITNVTSKGVTVVSGAVPDNIIARAFCPVKSKPSGEYLETSAAPNGRSASGSSDGRGGEELGASETSVSNRPSDTDGSEGDSRSTDSAAKADRVETGDTGGATSQPLNPLSARTNTGLLDVDIPNSRIIPADVAEDVGRIFASAPALPIGTPTAALPVLSSSAPAKVNGNVVASPTNWLAPPIPLRSTRSPSKVSASASSAPVVRRSATFAGSEGAPVASTSRLPSSSPSKRAGHHRTQSYAGDGDAIVQHPPATAPEFSSTSQAQDPEAQFQDSIAKQAEALRRERQERREKEEAESQQARSQSRGPAGDGRPVTPDPTKTALVGNLIGEDHVNYVLMYNMLTGIRIGVSRCQAKVKRPLSDDDYTARHKYSFDIVGNELTPSARYDFKFKDYAPWIFRDLREYFHLDPADYLLSLTAKYILSELGSPGKSGSFFYFSRDYRFIIKTIRHSEHKFLLKILKDYHTHVKANPHTLISRFYGLHRVKLPRGRKIHFVIMNNLFPPHRDVHETYDLKGSAIGREYPEEKAKAKPGAVLKDLNWVHRNRQLELGPEKRAYFEEQVKRDTELLQRLGIMDYSLLIGIHSILRGSKEGLREKGLTLFQPEEHKLRRRPTQIRQEREADASALRKAVQRSDPREAVKLPMKDRSERRYFLFYQDEGGFRATDEANDPLDTIYYLGIIDILTPYTWIKTGETFFKGLKWDRHMISAVPPKEYGDRFMRFLYSVIRGADTTLRPKME